MHVVVYTASLDVCFVEKRKVIYHYWSGLCTLTLTVKVNKLAPHTGLTVDSYSLPTSKSRDAKTRTKIKNSDPISFLWTDGRTDI